VVGVDGALGSAWRYELYGLSHYTSLLQNFRNFLSNSAISDALQVTTDATGRPVCISGGRCVPYNIFSAGAVTEQQVAWLEKALSNAGNSTEQIIEGGLTGELANLGLVLPLAHEGLTLNVGFQHRSESLRFVPDPTQQPDDLSGYGIAPIPLDRSVSVNEGYVEVRAPLVQDMPAVRELSVAAGYRFSGYSTAATTNTWKFDVQYAPMRDARLRASFDRAVREPSLIELYAPLAYNFSSTIPEDPCAPSGVGAQHATASLAQCLHTGLTAAQYGDGIARAYGGTSTVPQCAGRCLIFTGGNPGLQAEHSDTWSAGALLTPRDLANASISVDYFHINLHGEIAAVPEGVTLQQCLTTGDPVLCKQIVRAPSGALSGSTLAGGYILANSVNTGSALVSC
jgi:iron complex outermembrane recepter protein